MCSFVVCSERALVQVLATNLLTRGYWYYVVGHIPEEKAPESVDQKLAAKYGLALTRWQRARRKRNGLANVRYLRFGHDFLMVATDGEHTWFSEESGRVMDARRRPIRLGGYEIGLRRKRSKGGLERWRVRVLIQRAVFKALKAQFLELALHRSAETLAQAFWEIPFEPYGGVRRQLVNVLTAVNQLRRRAGYDRVPFAALRYRRRVERVYLIEKS